MLCQTLGGKTLGKNYGFSPDQKVTREASSLEPSIDMNFFATSKSDIFSIELISAHLFCQIFDSNREN